ncbi:MAG TPA: hypothetical protein VK530_08845 [Candidatus Acidoferrum sp.]|nr:hypothetical protein [Candidatus Acidoferrum sp.]
MNSLRCAVLWRNIVMALLLVSALGMIAVAVSGNSEALLANLPQLVHDTLKRSFAGAI